MPPGGGQPRAHNLPAAAPLSPGRAGCPWGQHSAHTEPPLPRCMSTGAVNSPPLCLAVGTAGVQVVYTVVSWSIQMLWEEYMRIPFYHSFLYFFFFTYFVDVPWGWPTLTVLFSRDLGLGTVIPKEHYTMMCHFTVFFFPYHSSLGKHTVRNL